jgi:hypothetical protein
MRNKTRRGSGSFQRERPDLHGLESDNGWLHASSHPLGPAIQVGITPLFGRDSLISSLPIALSNRRQAWNIGARWALANR